MTEQADFVGPIITKGEVSDAAIEAAHIDNPGREIRVSEHAAYVRLEARGELILHFATIAEVIGHPFVFGELERNMPGFAGFIRNTEDNVRFVASKKQ